MLRSYFLPRMELCTLIGTLAGINAGFWTTIAQILNPNVPWSATEMILLLVAIGTFAFVCISVCLIGFFRYTAGSVIWPTLVNLFLVTAATILVVNGLQFPALNCVIGFLIGWIVGRLLCLLCRNRLGDLTHVR